MTFRHGRIAGKHEEGDLIREGRNAEDAAAHMRRHQEREAIREAYQNKPARLAALYREEGKEELADLIERGRWSRKRGALSLFNSKADIKQEVIANVRTHEWRERRANGGTLPRGSRPRFVEGKLTDMAEMGELDRLSPANADQERVSYDRECLKAEIIADLGRGRRRGRRVRHPAA
jgi:hypothetical protein